MRHRVRIFAFATALSLGLIAAYLSPLAIGGEQNPVPITGAPAVSELTALSTVRGAELPADVRATADHFSQGVGQIDVPAVRLLESGLDKENVGVYAMPVLGGQVCYYISSTVAPGGSCVGSFDDDVPVAVSVYSGAGIPPTIAGLAPDDVTGVDVILKGSRTAAILRNNVVFFEAADAKRADIGGLVVHYRTGASRTLSFDFTVGEPELG